MTDIDSLIVSFNNQLLLSKSKVITIQKVIRGHLSRRILYSHRYILFYYDKYLKKLNVKKITQNSAFYFALEYLYKNIKKECDIDDIKKYVVSKGIILSGGDSLQIRHLGMQKGYNILKGGDIYKDVKIKKSNFMLCNLVNCFNGYTSEKRSEKIDDANWKNLLEEYGNKCVNCGSVNNEPLRWNGNKITVLQQGHMDPTKPLTLDNTIPQCSICNQQYKNKAIFNKRGFVIGFNPDGFLSS